MISHGICEHCRERLQWERGPTLVISRREERFLPLLSHLLEGEPAIRLVIERRHGERRKEKNPYSVERRSGNGCRRRP